MKRKLFVIIACAAVLGALMTACGRGVKAKPGVSFPLAVAETSPVFLFPVNFDHTGAPGDSKSNGAVVTGAITSKFGKRVIAAKELYDFVGNLSFELAEAIDASVAANSWRFDGERVSIAAGLSALMQKVQNRLVALRLIGKDQKFRYIVVLHSHGYAAPGSTSISIGSWGGIYDLENGEICSYAKINSTIPNAGGEILARLSEIYNEMIERLISGK